MIIKTSGQIRTLTSLRFFAAAAIIFHHSPADWFGGGGNRHLSIGVDFFFVLSGFILKYTYQSFAGIGEIRRFWIARIARLWPAHMSAALLMYLVSPRLNRWEYYSGRVPELLANLALVQAWIPLKRFALSFNTPSWSVSDEAFFYLCFPVLIMGWRYNGGMKWITCLLALGICMAIASQPALFGHPLDDLSVGVTTLLYTNPVARLFEFLLGISIAGLIVPVKSLLLNRPYAATIAELSACALVITAFVKIGLANYFSPFVVMYEMTMVVPAISFAVMIVVFSAEGGVISCLIQNKVAVRLGEISYSIYILHWPIMYYVLHTRPQTFARLSAPAAQLALWAVLLVASHLNWQFVEIPGRRFILRHWHAKPIGSLEKSDATSQTS